jgi:rod shape-determining protein MreD
MKFYQSNFISNILVFVIGLLFIIMPTALTGSSMNSTYSLYPDLFLCFIFATVINIPRITNLYSILLLLLFSDVLHMKPIGLFTMLVLTSFIVIQRYSKQIEKLSFFIHYFIFFIAISCVQLLNIFLHQLFFMPKLSLLTVLNQTIFTLICYPLFDIPYKLLTANKR